MAYRGQDRIDVTRKGGSPFGPSWKLLSGALATRRAGLEDAAAWDRYREAYLEEMRAIRRATPEIFRSIMKSCTLVCYCTHKSARQPVTEVLRCHRIILATEILPKICEVDYMGER